MNAEVSVDVKSGLKKLLLSGMANSIDERNAEAVANQMSYIDFLELLIQDELLLKEQKKYKRRYQKAGFKLAKTLSNFDFSFNPKINQKLIYDLATCRFISEKAPVAIVGPCGTGKSHLAQALGHCAIKKGLDVYYVTQANLAYELQEAKALNQFAKKLKKLSKIALLIIDDFGIKQLNKAEEESLHELIDVRYEVNSTMVTSNLSFEEWPQAFNNQLLAVATIGRIKDNCYEVKLEGKNYRRPKQIDDIL